MCLYAAVHGVISQKTAVFIDPITILQSPFSSRSPSRPSELFRFSLIFILMLATYSADALHYPNRH